MPRHKDLVIVDAIRRLITNRLGTDIEDNYHTLVVILDNNQNSNVMTEKEWLRLQTYCNTLRDFLDIQ